MPRKSIARKFTITDFYSSFHFLWNPEFAFHGEAHEMWEIVFVKSGEVEVTENEKIYLLERNNLIIHAPWEFHRIRSAGGTSPEVYVMSFYANGEIPLQLKEGVFILDAEQGLKHIALCRSVGAFLTDTHPSPYGGQEAADSLSAFLVSLSGENVNPRSDTSAAATEYRKIVVSMTNHVCENKTLSDFARECGDSVSYIKQLFQKYAGISPKAYYNQLRIRHATKLLEQDVPVREIAERMNFSSSNYFSSFFKQHTGFSPNGYRHKGQ